MDDRELRDAALRVVDLEDDPGRGVGPDSVRRQGLERECEATRRIRLEDGALDRRRAIVAVGRGVSRCLDKATHDKVPLQAMTNDVRILRERQGLSQGQLAEALGVSRQTINAIETGRYLPSLPLAFAIARYFGRPIEELFHDERHD